MPRLYIARPRKLNGWPVIVYNCNIMSYMRMCCDNCGAIGKHNITCETCKGVVYCTRGCRNEDSDHHEQYCDRYMRRTAMRQWAHDMARHDINVLFSNETFARFIRALHEAWDPFYNGHISCTVQRKSYYVAALDSREPYLQCDIQFMNVIISSNKERRVIKTRYIYCGISLATPIIYSMNISFDTRDGADSYNKMCHDMIMDIRPDSDVAVTLNEPGTCVLIVDGRKYIMI